MAPISDRVRFFQDVGELIQTLKIEGHEFMPTCFYRSQSEQISLYAQGKSMTLDSKHTHWLAIDLVLVKYGQLVWGVDPAYKRAGELWESLGHTWGGRWESLLDIYHFEI